MGQSHNNYYEKSGLSDDERPEHSVTNQQILAGENRRFSSVSIVSRGTARVSNLSVIPSIDIVCLDT